MATYSGTASANTLNYSTGTAGSTSNLINGLGGNDTITAGSGNDTLDGGTGDDVMSGGLGNDIYIVDSALDKVIESAGQGIDTIQSSLSLNLSTFAVNVENLTLTGTAVSATGNALANQLLGNASNNTLTGLDGDDVLDGGAGNDTLLGGNQNDLLLGGDGSDSLDGGAGSDVLMGGSIDPFFGAYAAGNALDRDTLIGGTGDDYYYVATGTEKIVEDSGAGNDTLVLAAVAGGKVWNLGANIENAQVGFDGVMTVADANAYGVSYTVNGNDLNNVLWGSAGANYLTGGLGSDTLYGANGDDDLRGGDGSDLIEGGAGNDVLMGGSIDPFFGAYAAGNVLDRDTLIGGAGDDYYYVATGTEKIVEDSGAGNDTLVLAAVAGGKVWSLGSNIENAQVGFDGVMTVADANAYGVSYTVNGNDLNNVLWGSGGANYLTGGLGNDTLYGANGNDELWGGDGSDLMDGGAGSDILMGGSNGSSYDAGGGLDTLIGGSGDDYYYVASGTEKIVEDAGAGNDTLVLASVAGGKIWNLGANIENAQSMRDGVMTLADANSIAVSYTVNGNDLNNLLWGSAGANLLTGGLGGDTLYGASGDDTLNGGAGADLMVGGQGSDYYVVDSVDDVVIEDVATAGDFDVVSASVNIDAADAHLLGLEGVELQGWSSLTASGNALDNVLVANDASCSLYGRDGDDQLFGGSGQDDIHGDAGNDILIGGGDTDWLFGGVGDDQLAGDAGNDILMGEDGSDTYYEVGAFGADFLLDQSGALDQVQFVDASYQNLWFSQSGQSLLVQQVGTSNSVLLHEWFSIPDGVEQFVSSEGQVLTSSKVTGLVQAMSGFSPQDIAQAPTQLRSAVNQAWAVAPV